jgi:hypothetical protein
MINYNTYKEYVTWRDFMSVRIQVIINEEELARFKQQAKRNSKSLSAWMRDAANKALQQEEKQKELTSPSELEKFFQECKYSESGNEPDWNEHKRLILEGYHQGTLP